MKKFTLLLTLLAFFAFAEKGMRIFRADGTDATEIVNQIDSIIFFDTTIETNTETLILNNLWEVKAIYDNGSEVNILESVQLALADTDVPFIFSMKEMNSISSTSGPLFMYLVYGDNNWNRLANRISSVFHYLAGDNTYGSWAITDTKQLSIKLKLQPAGFSSLVEVLESVFGPRMFSVSLDRYILHHFKNVDVSFEGENMIWELTDNTQLTNSTFGWNNEMGTYDDAPFMIQGVSYSRCRLVLAPFTPSTTTEQTIYTNLTK